MPEPLPAAEPIDEAEPGHARLLWATGLLGAATLAVKFAALAKDFYVARQLGTADALDAYLVALLLPSYAVVVLAHTASSALVPAYVRLWQGSGIAAAQRLAGSVLVAAAAGLVAITVALVALAPLVLPCMGMGFDADKLALTRSLFYPMAGIVLMSGLGAVFGAILEAHERFAAKAIAPLAIPLGTLIVYWWFEHAWGVHALALGTLVGFVAEAAILGFDVWRRGLLPAPRFGERPELVRLGHQYAAVATGGMLMSSALLVDQSMAASLGSGQVSALNYGGKVVSVVVNVVAFSLSTVLLPRFSHQIAAGQWTLLKRTFLIYAGGIFLALIPAVAVLVVISRPLVSILFERGAFTADDTLIVTGVQQWLLLQMPFYIVVVLGFRVLSALDGNRTVLAIGGVNLAMNVTGNLVLMHWFGVYGIAISTSLMFLVAAAITLVAVRAKLSEVEPR